MEGLYVAAQVAVVVGLDLADEVPEFVEYLLDFERAAQRVGTQPQSPIPGKAQQAIRQSGGLPGAFEPADTERRRSRAGGEPPVGLAQGACGVLEVRVVAGFDGAKPGIARGEKIGIFDFINLQLMRSY